MWMSLGFDDSFIILFLQIMAGEFNLGNNKGLKYSRDDNVWIWVAGQLADGSLVDASGKPLDPESFRNPNIFELAFYWIYSWITSL